MLVWLKRLACLAGEPWEAGKISLAWAQYQQQQGKFSAAYSQLLESILALRRAKEHLTEERGTAYGSDIGNNPGKEQDLLYYCLLHRFSLLHSYLLVPRVLKQGNQHNAALLLIRLSANLVE